MTKRVALLRAKTGTYTDRKTGQDKSSYATIGNVLQRDDGSRMYKLDTLPVDFDGWIYEGDLPAVQPTQGDLQRSQPQSAGFSDLEGDPPF